MNKREVIKLFVMEQMIVMVMRIIPQPNHSIRDITSWQKQANIFPIDFWDHLNFLSCQFKVKYFLGLWWDSFEEDPVFEEDQLFDVYDEIDKDLTLNEGIKSNFKGYTQRKRWSLS